MKTYKIRKFQNGRNSAGEPFINFSLTIPTPIAEKLPKDMQFSCELTADGILFRPVEGSAEVVELPDWAKSEANGSTAKKSRSRPRPGAKAT
jgi:hypothetical protein